MRKALFLFLVFFASVAVAQHFAERKYHHEGPLQWEDFQAIPPNSMMASELRYFLGYSTVKEIVNDTVLTRLKVYAYSDRSLSWVNQQYKSEALLRFNQVIFDLLEAHCRMLQHELDRCRNFSLAESIFQERNQELQRQVNALTAASASGTDLRQLPAWELQASELLRANPLRALPTLKPYLFEYGFHGGLQFTGLTGSLGKAFSPAPGLMYGFDFGYGKNIWEINLALGWNRARKDLSPDFFFRKSEKTSLSAFDFSWGRIVKETHQNRLTSFIGFCFAGITAKDTLNDAEWKAFGPVAGIHYDFKLVKKMKVHAWPKETANTILRLRCFASYLPFSSDVRGVALNLSIALAGVGHFLKVEPRTETVRKITWN